jgi:amino acid permease
MSSFVLAVSTMVGTIVGAGIFGIPYVVTISGVVPSIFYFFLIGAVVALLHLFFGEVCLRTSGKHRLVGYAQMYLGSWGKLASTLILVFVLLGTLLAYLILVGDFAQIIFEKISLPLVLVPILFSIVALVFVLLGRRLITKVEFFTNIAFLVAIGLLFLFALPHLHWSNFALPFIDMPSLSNLFLPFGVFLFAFIGFEAVPEVMSFLRDTHAFSSLKKVLIASSIAAGLFFFLFAFAVLGVSGANTSPDAFSGLLPFLGETIISFGAIFGILVIADSFLVLGNYLKNSLRHDFSIPTIPAALLALGTPLALFLLGLREFIGVISIVGGVFGAVEGVLIVLIFQAAKVKGDRTPEYSIKVPSPVLFLIAILLVGGAAATLLL